MNPHNDSDFHRTEVAIIGSGKSSTDLMMQEDMIVDFAMDLANQRRLEVPA